MKETVAISRKLFVRLISFFRRRINSDQEANVLQKEMAKELEDDV